MKCNLGDQKLQQFLYLPEYPITLVDRDLLCKLNAQVTFPEKEHFRLQVPPKPTSGLQTTTLGQAALVADPVPGDL